MPVLEKLETETKQRTKYGDYYVVYNDVMDVYNAAHRRNQKPVETNHQIVNIACLPLSVQSVTSDQLDTRR